MEKNKIKSVLIKHHKTKQKKCSLGPHLYFCNAVMHVMSSIKAVIYIEWSAVCTKKKKKMKFRCVHICNAMYYGEPFHCYGVSLNESQNRYMLPCITAMQKCKCVLEP